MESRSTSHWTLVLERLVLVAVVLACGAAAAWQPTPVLARPAPTATLDAVSPQTFTITPAPGPHGWISPPIPQSVPAGGSLTCSINANAGYHVADVLVDGVSVGARSSYEFTNVQADHTISATFAEDTVRVFTITPAPGPHGWISPPIPQSVPAGGSLTCSINANAGYHVADVLVDGVSVGARSSYEFTNVQADHTISATFAEDTVRVFTITPAPGPHGWISPPIPQSVPAGGSLTCSINANAGYHVADVLVDGVSVGARSSYEFTNVQADHTISASFAVDSGETFTINPSAGDHGAITPPTPQSVAGGASISFAIAADAGYHVADVLVDGVSVGARSSYEFTNVQADHTISASFAVDVGPVVTITSPTGGEAWRRGSTQVIRWTLSAPVGAGRFTVWASAPGGDLTQLTPPGSPVAAVAGSTEYEWSHNVALPAAATYQILVRYESDAGEVQSEARSPGMVTVTSQVRISVMSPSGTATWRQGSNQTVRWKLSEPVAAGDFRVWALSATGTRYRVTGASKPVAAVDGKTSYSARWKVKAPPGKGYRIIVEHWWAGIKLATGKSTGRLTIKR